MFTLQSSRRLFSAAAFLAALAFHGRSVSAATHTWVPTAPGTTYDWLTTTQNNWGTGAENTFPNAIGDIANLNIDITGAQTIRVAANVLIGALNLGDLDGASSININSTGTPTKFISFEVPTGSASINLGANGTSVNTIGTSVFLASDLKIVAAGGQRLTTSGVFNADTRNVAVTGGANFVQTWAVNGDLIGSGNITHTGAGGMVINSNIKSFSGTITLNGTGRAGDGNTGTLTTTTGSLFNAAEVTINGAFSGTMVSAGGNWHAGNNSPAGANPGQRFTQHKITLNSGWLDNGGQSASPVLAGDPLTDTPWRRGEEFVRDNVDVIRLNSGLNQIVVNNSITTSGTILEADSLERSAGATVYMRSSQWAGRSRFTFLNSGVYLKGAGGAEGTSQMSIIPWMAAGSSSNTPGGFATYVTNGVRALNPATERAADIFLGADHNVAVASVPAISGPVSINSLSLTGSSTGNMGAGGVLTVLSGGVFFENSGSRIGGTGSADAGALDFATSEGVVWSNGANINAIGASITGSGGLSKAGTGTLILSGAANEYSGLTYVASGLLQVGDAGNFSSLGHSSDIRVASGAALTLAGGNMIADSATLRIEQFGLFNGKVNLSQDVNETVAALWLGDQLMGAGTYGSVDSDANFESDQWFSGTGMITVVPEPASAVFLLAGMGVTLARRRRR